MSATLSHVEAREQAITAAMELATCERHIHDQAGAASRVGKLQDVFYLACRDLVNAVDDMPPNLRPRNWALDPEAATA